MSEPETDSETNDLPEYWDALLPGIDIPRMSDDQLREFVFDVIGGRIFVDRQVDNPTDVPMVFYPLLFGALDGYNRDSIQSYLGCVYEYIDKALPRSVNGNPIFMSMRLMHAEDWKRARAAIVAEQERRKSIPI